MNADLYESFHRSRLQSIIYLPLSIGERPCTATDVTSLSRDVGSVTSESIDLDTGFSTIRLSRSNACSRIQPTVAAFSRP